MLLRKFFFIFILLFANQGFAYFDYSAGAAARLLPQGANVFGELGYNQLVWGEKKNTDDFKYGFIRPAVRAQSSLIVNRADVWLGFYPISIFGFEAGYYQSIRNVDIDTIDCNLNNCSGRLGGPFIRTKLLVGYKNFFLGGVQRFAWLNASTKDKPWAEESSALIGSKTNDTHASTDVYLGYKISDTCSLGTYIAIERMLNSGSNSDLQSLFVRKIFSQNWSALLGSGSFRSTTHDLGLTVFGVLKWTGKSSLEL